MSGVLLAAACDSPSVQIVAGRNAGPEKRCYLSPDAGFESRDCVFAVSVSDHLCDVDVPTTVELRGYNSSWSVLTELVTFDVSDTDIASYNLPAVPEHR